MSDDHTAGTRVGAVVRVCVQANGQPENHVGVLLAHGRVGTTLAILAEDYRVDGFMWIAPWALLGVREHRDSRLLMALPGVAGGQEQPCASELGRLLDHLAHAQAPVLMQPRHDGWGPAAGIVRGVDERGEELELEELDLEGRTCAALVVHVADIAVVSWGDRYLRAIGEMRVLRARWKAVRVSIGSRGPALDGFIVDERTHLLVLSNHGADLMDDGVVYVARRHIRKVAPQPAATAREWLRSEHGAFPGLAPGEVIAEVLASVRPDELIWLEVASAPRKGFIGWIVETTAESVVVSAVDDGGRRAGKRLFGLADVAVVVRGSRRLDAVARLCALRGAPPRRG